MFPRDLLVKPPVGRSPGNGTAISSADRDSGYDEIAVQRILAAVSQRHPRTIGEFAHIARPYLGAGYQREVAEAHRRYFSGPSQN
jgi:hypothetical protein